MACAIWSWRVHEVPASVGGISGRGHIKMAEIQAANLKSGLPFSQSFVWKRSHELQYRQVALGGRFSRRCAIRIRALAENYGGNSELGDRAQGYLNASSGIGRGTQFKQFASSIKASGSSCIRAAVFPDVARLVIGAGAVVRLTLALHQFACNQQTLQSNSPKLRNEDFAGLVEAPTTGKLENAQRKVGQNTLQWNQTGRVAGRMFLIWTAAVCIAFWASGGGPAFACEGGGTGVLMPPLVGDAKSTIKSTLTAMWPKTRQVLEVLRDQGLLLSVLLSLSAFFSMAETSITTLWPWKVRELAEKEGEGGVFHVLRQDVTRFLTTILIGTTVVNIAATAMVTEAATALFGEAGVTAATGVMTVVLLLLTEIAPKSIAVHNATEVARVVVRPVAWLSIVLYPVGRVVTAMSTSLLKLLGLKSSGEPFVSEEELKLMLRGAELSGAIEEEEQDMIENVLEIKDTFVREVMTPLVDVVAIDAAATLLEFRNLWIKHQYSRVPVFERRIDNIVGIAYAMDMLDYVEQVELLQRMNVGRITHRPAYFVPDSMSVWNLLREFRIRKVHMAIVLNEYGGTVGVVTLEDVVEEIVGEIFDENDSKEEIRKKTGYVVQRADGVFDVDANTSIDDLAESLEVKLPEISYHYETVSGFVCEAFGYIPRTGESTKVVFRKADAEEGERRDGEGEHQEDRRDKFQKYRLEILAGNARKVGSVRFERMESLTLSKEENERGFPRTLRRGRDEDSDSANRSEAEEPHWQDPEESVSEESEEDSDDEGCHPSDEDAKDSPGYYLPESVRCGNELSTATADGLLMAGGEEDWEMEDMVEVDRTAGMGTDCEADASTASVVAKLTDKWEKEEAQVERRRNRRRKQSAEAAMELNRQRRSDLRRREAEAELAMATTPRRNGREEPPEPDSAAQEPGK